VETVEKPLLLLDFSTVSIARHFHNESPGLRPFAVFSPANAAEDPESLWLKTTRPFGFPVTVRGFRRSLWLAEKLRLRETRRRRG
jgi:hypothetical protein